MNKFLRLFYILSAILIYIIFGGIGALLILITFSLTGTVWALIGGPFLRGSISYSIYKGLIASAFKKNIKNQPTQIEEINKIVTKTLIVFVFVDYIINFILFNIP